MSQEFSFANLDPWHASPSAHKRGGEGGLSSGGATGVSSSAAGTRPPSHTQVLPANTSVQIGERLQANPLAPSSSTLRSGEPISATLLAQLVAKEKMEPLPAEHSTIRSGSAPVGTSYAASSSPGFLNTPMASWHSDPQASPAHSISRPFHPAPSAPPLASAGIGPTGPRPASPLTSSPAKPSPDQGPPSSDHWTSPPCTPLAPLSPPHLPGQVLGWTDAAPLPYPPRGSLGPPMTASSSRYEQDPVDAMLQRWHLSTNLSSQLLAQRAQRAAKLQAHAASWAMGQAAQDASLASWQGPAQRGSTPDPSTLQEAQPRGGAAIMATTAFKVQAQTGRGAAPLHRFHAQDILRDGLYLASSGDSFAGSAPLKSEAAGGLLFERYAAKEGGVPSLQRYYFRPAKGAQAMPRHPPNPMTGNATRTCADATQNASTQRLQSASRLLPNGVPVSRLRTEQAERVHREVVSGVRGGSPVRHAFPQEAGATQGEQTPSISPARRQPSVTAAGGLHGRAGSPSALRAAGTLASAAASATEPTLDDAYSSIIT
ncbi:hypothetical protein QJQ45_023773, partial [Haematococcus lacustris]